MKTPRYSDFVDKIDLDAFEEAIGFSPEYQQGSEDQGFCLDLWGLHKNGDTTGKFSINRDKKVWNCWVCGGGSLLDLAMHVNNLDTREAADWLYQFAHGEQKDDEEFSDYLLKLMEDTEERIASLPYFNEMALERFTDGPRDWFYEQGICDKVIDAHHLIYDPKAFKPSPKKNNGDKVGEDYIGPAAIWPHYWSEKYDKDVEPRLVGWQHRWVNHGVDTPKYLGKWTNTSEFPSKETVYGLDYAMRSLSPIVVTESCKTVCFLESWDIPAIATFGAEVSDAQLRILRRFQMGVILCPDNDPHGAGAAAVNAVAKYLVRFIPVYRLPPVTVKPGADLADFMLTDDPYGNLIEHLDLVEEEL